MLRGDCERERPIGSGYSRGLVPQSLRNIVYGSLHTMCERYRENTVIPKTVYVKRCPTKTACGAHKKRGAYRGHGEKHVFGGAARDTQTVAEQNNRSATLRLALKGWAGK